MRKFIYLMAILIGAMFAAGCGDSKKASADTGKDTTVIIVDTVEDHTIYGRCGDGTSMNALELITSDGDTLYIMVNDDSIPNVKGGLGIGDRMAVVLDETNLDDGILRAHEAVNLTTLLGKWVGLDKSFELQEGGVVISPVKEPKPLVEWKISNGQLVLSADTFSVYELGADSLLLENSRGIYAYKRMR